MNKKQRVAVIGASQKPERYSNQAVRMLLEHGHETIPVNPAIDKIEGITVARHISHITGHVDTVTLYTSPTISNSMQEALMALKPDRVIFNPGAENAPLSAALEANGIQTQEACTLVLLKTDQF